MDKRKLIWIGALVVIFIILLFVFNKKDKSELTKLVDRYREIQEEYKFHEEEMNKLHIEAEEIRNYWLENYWILFTEAWLEEIM